MTIDIIDRLDTPNSRALAALCQSLLAFAVREETAGEDFQLSLTLTDNAGIQALNKEFRNLDKPTDVLSFPLVEFSQEDILEYADPETEEIMLGDIVISLEKAAEQAEEYGHSLEREAGFLCIHGALHLLGYDHETETDRQAMRKREEAVLKSYDLTR